jgi:putative transposase
MPQRVYPSDLTDAEWAIVAPLIPPAKPGGHPRRVDMRQILNALFSQQRTGCQWRYLPKEYPPWPTVWTYVRQWRRNGAWETLHTTLRETLRRQIGREATPSAAIIDRQSVKTTQKGGRAATMAVKR